MTETVSKIREGSKSDNGTSEAFATLRTQLVGSLVEREAEVDALLLGLVAQEHVLLVGPPGTAKSTLANSLTSAISKAECFSILLTKYTTPEEVFGPIKLTALREDRYERAIQRYAPTAHVLFIDEIWKASSAILNTNLTLLQEREFDNGGKRIKCPLRIAVAASNEFPGTEEAQELGAMFDRFLIRRVVRPVSHQGRERLLFGELPRVSPCLDLADLDVAAKRASALPFSDDAKQAYHQILDQLGAAGVRPGDRRVRKAVGIAKARAWLVSATEGETRDKVQPADLECLQDVLWSAPEQRDQCATIVTKLANPVGAKLTELLRQVDEIMTKVTDMPTRMAAIKKLEQCEEEAKGLVSSGNGRAQKVTRHIRMLKITQTGIAMGMDEAKAKQQAAIAMES